MSTARDLISASLRIMGVQASGESPSAAEATDALSALNIMLDAWSNQSLLIPNKVRDVFALSGAQTYTFGTGGTWNSARPMKIEEALIQLTGTSPVLELPMKILTKEQYAGITLKTLASTFPLYLYPDYAYPLINVNVYPVPTEADNVVLYSWKPLSQLATLDTALSLPQGYERAIKYNLALELMPEYGKSASPEVLGIATESKSEIKRMNSKPRYLRVDEALSGKPAVWNWRTGGNG